MPQISPAPSKDIQDTIESFSQGNTQVLDAPGVVDILAQYVLNLYHSGDMGDALILLEQLGEASLSDELVHRERSLIVLSLVAEKVLEEDNEDLLEAIAHMLMRWLKRETEFNGGFEYICLQLSKLLQRMLELNLWYQAESLVADLKNIKDEETKKNRLLTRVVSRIHGNLAQNNLLERLIKTYIDAANDKSEVAGTLLLHLSSKSVLQMLGTLSICEDKNQRLRLLDIIPETGTDAVPCLLEELNNTPSWYYARNIIHLITKIGDPELFTYVEPFMEHKDIRVQQEVIECARKISCEGLLKALNVCDDRLKPNIIRLLGGLKEQRIGSAFIGLLENYTVFEQHMQDDIVKEVCNYIHLYPGVTSERAIEALIDDHNDFKHFSDSTFKTVEYAYVALKNGIEPIESDQEIPELQIGPETGITPLSDAPDAERLKPNPGDATKNWFKTFTENENTPLPLKNHLIRRKDLYSRLSHDEFLAFSALLTHHEYKKGERLATAGDIHSNLFFIEKGEISLTFPSDGSEIEIQNLKMGDIFGHEIFMTGSEWMVSLEATSTSAVFIFDQEQLLNLQPNYPMLCQKILEYSKANDIVLRLVRATTSESLCYSDNDPIVFKGGTDHTLSDIKILEQFSHGICFCFEPLEDMNASMFSGRELSFYFDKIPAKPLQVTGYAIGSRIDNTETRRCCIFAKFFEEVNLSGYTCTHISL